MFDRGSLVKPVSVLCMGALLACSGGGSAQSNVPAVAAPGADPAQAADAATRTTASAVSVYATTIQTCTLTSPCISGTNTSSGAGVAGISTNGRGVSRTTKHNSTASSNGMFGVYGQDLSTSGIYDGGVFGTSVRGYGVYGQSSSGFGIRGASSTSIGVYGISTNANGVYGISQNNYGSVSVSGSASGAYASGATYGIYAIGDTSGVFGNSSGSGTGVYATSGSGFALQAHSAGSVGAYVTNSNGNGADVTGQYIGVVARAPTGGFPLVLTDSTGNNLFYVDGSGNVFYHGSLSHFASVLGGGSATAFSPSSTRPAIEDTGTARLVSGRANVSFDPTFARAIDTQRGYQVFLTPNGDTRGLFVALKSASGFVVREVQGGRGTFDFDYHVYATALGAQGAHMTMVRPNAPVIHRIPAKVPPAVVPQPAE